MSWEDFDSKQRAADREAENRSAWTAAICLIVCLVIAVFARACS